MSQQLPVHLNSHIQTAGEVSTPHSLSSQKLEFGGVRYKTKLQTPESHSAGKIPGDWHVVGK